jgi:hypothetical protein
MKSLDQKGVLNTLMVPFIMMIVLFLVASGFGIWAFMSRQDYKNNTDKKIAAAVQVAKQQTATAKDNQFTQEEKKPLKDFNGPEAYGSLDIKYPKTWSGYVIQDSTSSIPINGYFYPGVVPGVLNGAIFALQVQVVSTPYANTLSQFDALIQSESVQASPFALPKVPSVVGTRLDGQISVGQQGSLILLPLRNQTLEISTDAPQFVSDFNNLILPNFLFSP